MMEFHVKAFNANGAQIFGNLDGQRVWHGRDYKRTIWYKCLRNGRIAPAQYPEPRVRYWVIMNGDRVCETVFRQ